MDIVLGVSMAPTSVRMLLVEGENADGVTVEDNQFDFTADDDAATLSAADQVISAILGTREGATEAGHALTSTGVTWTDPVDAAALRDALATRKVENVMLVSSFMAAAALAQTVGCTVGDTHTALLFLEPDTVTLAVVDAADGSITDVHKELISGGHSVTELAGMVADLASLDTRPQSVFIVGSGVDVATIKPQLEAATALPVTAAEEPDTALAWGAALASANAPLFASSTAALAYALDPGTGAIDPYAVSPGYLAAPNVPLGATPGEDDLAYSAVPDEDADAHTITQEPLGDGHFDDEHSTDQPERRRLVLVGSILAVAFVAAALSLEVALALGIRPSVAFLPRPLQNLIIQSPVRPAAPAPAPASADIPAVLPAPANAPIPAALPPVPAAPAPAPPPVALPVPAPAPIVEVPALPAAPPPAPVVAAPPIFVPLPVPIPVQRPNPVHVGPVRGPTAPVYVPPAPPPVQLPDPKPPVVVPPVIVPPIQPPVQQPDPVRPVPQAPPLIPGLPGLPGLGIPGLPGIPAPGVPQGPSPGSPGGIGGNPGGNPGGIGDNPGGFGGGPGGFGGNPGGHQGGFGGNPGGFGGNPGGFGGGPGGFGGGPGSGHSSGGFGGGGFGGGGFGGGGHSGGFGGGGLGGGGHGGGGHH